MKYNIMGFNQKLLVDKYNNLNGNDVIVLRALVDILPRMTRTLEIEKKEYKQVTYNLLLEDIPFVTHSISTLKKIVQKLIDINLIDRYISNKGGRFTYFRVTENLKQLLYISKEEKKITNVSTKTNKKINNIKEKLGDKTKSEEVLSYIEDTRIKAVKEKITTGKISEELPISQLKK